MCVCVCVFVCLCVCVCVFVLYALNPENMYIGIICKRLGHVRVSRSKYPATVSLLLPLLLFLLLIGFKKTCDTHLHLRSLPF